MQAAPLETKIALPLQRVLEEKFISLLRSCRSCTRLHQIQAQILTHGLHPNDYVTPTLITACTRLTLTRHARTLFHTTPQPNTATWNALFRAHSHNDVVLLFAQMHRAQTPPNAFTFPMVIKSCANANAISEGEQLHCVVAKRGFKSNPFVGTALIHMYSARGSLKLFDEMPNRDVMSWNTVLNGYANNGEVESFEKLFEEMPERNVYSWNGLIGGYVRNGLYKEALEAFKRMLVMVEEGGGGGGGGVVPNDYTLVAVLSACSRLGDLEMGKWVHVYAESVGYKGNLFVGNALIDMYAKCGVIVSAVDVFNCLDVKDIITWNTIINGLAMHGYASDALRLFEEMKGAGEKPDGVTFVGILSACTHMGLVKDGFLHFQSMVDDYSIVPQIEHYGCMVDLLGRAGLIGQAVDFVRKMPMEPDAVIWAALLGACRIYKNVEVAELALQRLIELEPQNPANFVMLSNVYKDLGRWQDVARLKMAMRDTGFKKLPGCSVIGCNDSVVEFYSLDERHPETESIYRTLKGLTILLRSHGYVPNLVDVAHGNWMGKEVF
uniref:Pentatricopeptide repeat-containing protein At2g20540 n=1 Tax=Cajanus cajan TaxID=3821 RepID=A0A151UBD0_CAJCA|nr:Pentatricopeptide repeat-containing protein At2g20540 [Cajanus cajan]